VSGAQILAHVQLELPWVLVLLPAPLLVWLLLPAYRERQESVRIPFFEEATAATGRKPSSGAVVLRLNWLQRIVAPLVWVLIVLAVSRPVWVEDPIEKVQAARDLMLAVDLSQSMEARDFRDPAGNRLDRLEAVKLVLDDFITRRESDRIGLIVFGGQAFLQAPFTLDHEVSRQMLAETRIGMAGPQTVIGDAIGLSLKAFEGSETPEKVLVLLTDGNDTGSRIPPQTAADLAAEQDITIHTVAIGDPEAQGEERVDLEALQDIAAATGGRAFRGEDREGLEAVYRELDTLEPVEVETLSYRPRRPLYFWPLGLAVLLVFAYHLLMGLRAGARALRTRHGHA
jgi:Ca-activated chloride channel family protein